VFLPPPPDLYETNRLTERLARLEAAPLAQAAPSATLAVNDLAIRRQRERVRELDARRRAFKPIRTQPVTTATQTPDTQQAEAVPIAIATSVTATESPIDRFRERMRLRLNAVNTLPFRTVIEPLDRTQAQENQIRENRKQGQITRRAAEREQARRTAVQMTETLQEQNRIDAADDLGRQIRENRRQGQLRRREREREQSRRLKEVRQRDEADEI